MPYQTLCNLKGQLISQGMPNHNSHLQDNLQEVIFFYYLTNNTGTRSKTHSRRGSLKSNGIKNQVKSKLETMQALDSIKKDI